MVLSTTKMTAEQFLELGEDPVGVRLELLDGQIAIGPSLTPSESFTCVQLCTFIVGHVQAKALGELFAGVNTILDAFTVRRPDILYFSKARRHLIGKKAMEGPPDLAVEIIGPSSIEIDRIDKFAQYRSAGVANYWIVDPAERTIEAFYLRGKKYIPSGGGEKNQPVRLPPFQDLEIPLARLWRE
jgi:Uma2 family endonuclease